jgi:polyphosphate kinase 2
MRNKKTTTTKEKDVLEAPSVEVVHEQVEQPQPTESKGIETQEVLSVVSADDTIFSGATIALQELNELRTKKDLMALCTKYNANPRKILDSIRYEEELEKLQVELVKLQRWVGEKGKRIAILFEGRDAAGKGGTIRRFIEHLNPRAMRVVALPKPTEEELGQWYFQRYTRQLPNRGEMVFFDRSWYNRAVVEPVNGFCSKEQYDTFMHQVPEFEHMLYEDGILIIKFWFSISKDEQLRRFKSRQSNPLKQWKLSPVDMKAQDMWDTYTYYKEEMFSKTHNSFSPWIVVKANSKEKARLETIRYVLSIIPYEGKDTANISLHPKPNIITRYHRRAKSVD